MAIYTLKLEFPELFLGLTLQGVDRYFCGLSHFLAFLYVVIGYLDCWIRASDSSYKLNGKILFYRIPLGRTLYIFRKKKQLDELLSMENRLQKVVNYPYQAGRYCYLGPLAEYPAAFSVPCLVRKMGIVRWLCTKLGEVWGSGNLKFQGSSEGEWKTQPDG